MIRAVNLIKNYDTAGTITQALAGVSVHIKPGEFVSIMGPSGSGKSTLLQMLSFLDRPTSGTITFAGKEITDLTDSQLAALRNHNIGFIFQSFNLLGRSTVYQNVELPLLYSDQPASARPELIKKAIAAVGITEKINIEAARLSGGQKQRVAIARALVTDPSVIFADEPTGNLDSVSGSQVMEILKSLHAAGKTIILVTHDPVVARVANRLITIRDGLVASDQVV